jgi:hypothetical protein
MLNGSLEQIKNNSLGAIGTKPQGSGAWRRASSRLPG